MSTSRTEVLRRVRRVHVGDSQLGFAPCIACELETSPEAPLHVWVLIRQQSDQLHGRLVSCSCFELVPEHVGIVVVSMVTAQNHLLSSEREKDLRCLLDHECRHFKRAENT